MLELSTSSTLVLGDVIWRNKLCHGKDIAYVFEGNSVSFGEHYANASCLATALKNLGLRHQSRIAVMATNSYSQIVVFSACELFGFVVATVNYRLVGPEIVQVLGDCTPSVLIFDETYTDLIGSIRHSLPSILHFISIGNSPSWAIGLGALRLSVQEGEAVPWDIMPQDPRPHHLHQRHHGPTKRGSCVLILRRSRWQK